MNNNRSLRFEDVNWDSEDPAYFEELESSVAETVRDIEAQVRLARRTHARGGPARNHEWLTRAESALRATKWLRQRLIYYRGVAGKKRKRLAAEEENGSALRALVHAVHQEGWGLVLAESMRAAGYDNERILQWIGGPMKGGVK